MTATFIKKIMGSDYYFEAFKDHVNGLRDEYKNHKFHDDSLIKYLNNYSTYRKEYIDMEKYSKRI